MYLISVIRDVYVIHLSVVMIFTFSIKDLGYPKFLKSHFGHPVMKILAKSVYVGLTSCNCKNCLSRIQDNISKGRKALKSAQRLWVSKTEDWLVLHVI